MHALLFSISLTWASELPVLREQTREIVKSVTCGGCHTPGLSTTKTKALKIYNLNAPFWSASMSDRQLLDFGRRISTLLTPEETKELGRDIRRGQPSKAQIKVVNEFVSAELKNRKDDPMARFRDMQQTKFPEFYKVFEGVDPSALSGGH